MTRENKTLLYLMHSYLGFQSHIAEPEGRYGHVAEPEGRYGHFLLCKHLIYTYQYYKRQDREEARSLT